MITWASCQIRKIVVVHAPGIPGPFSPPPRVSDPDMHHGTCVTHVPWCMPGSLTKGFLWSRRRGKTFSAFPAHAQSTILRICWEAHSKLFLRCNHSSMRYLQRRFSLTTDCVSTWMSYYIPNFMWTWLLLLVHIVWDFCRHIANCHEQQPCTILI